MTVQSGLPPYTFRCLRCGLEWEPKRTSESGLEKESREHECAAVSGDPDRSDAHRVVDGPQ